MNTMARNQRAFAQPLWSVRRKLSRNVQTTMKIHSTDIARMKMLQHTESKGKSYASIKGSFGWIRSSRLGFDSLVFVFNDEAQAEKLETERADAFDEAMK